MKKLLAMLLIAGCVAKSMIISSPDFKNNDFIPEEFTCIGANNCPQIIVNDLPDNTKTLAIIMDDPDAPMGTWVHWVAWNIKPGEAINCNKGVIGINSWGRNEYGGPCPPSGTHHYYFKVYALDSELNLPASTDKQGLEQAMNSHILAKAELVGLFSK